MYQTPNWEYFVDVEFSSFLDREKYQFRSRIMPNSLGTLRYDARTSPVISDADFAVGDSHSWQIIGWYCTAITHKIMQCRGISIFNLFIKYLTQS